MPITLSAVVPTDHHTLTLSFSEPFVANSELFDVANYAFSVVYGERIDIEAALVTQLSLTDIRITLRDAMLSGGNYRITVYGVTGVDSIPIQDQAPANSLRFDGTGEPLASFQASRNIPAPRFDRAYPSGLHVMLAAAGEELAALLGPGDSAYQEARNAMSLNNATGSDLSLLGQNYGVLRSDVPYGDLDETFRKVIPIIGTSPKTIVEVFHRVLEALLGPSTGGWRLYCIRPNEVVVEVSGSLFYGLASGTLASATYLHADASVLVPPSYPGDYLVADASVPGSSVGGSIVLAFQGITLGNMLEKVKAATVQVSLEIVG